MHGHIRERKELSNYVLALIVLLLW